MTFVFLAYAYAYACAFPFLLVVPRVSPFAFPVCRPRVCLSAPASCAKRNSLFVVWLFVFVVLPARVASSPSYTSLASDTGQGESARLHLNLGTE